MFIISIEASYSACIDWLNLTLLSKVVWCIQKEEAKHFMLPTVILFKSQEPKLAIFNAMKCFFVIYIEWICLPLHDYLLKNNLWRNCFQSLMTPVMNAVQSMSTSKMLFLWNQCFGQICFITDCWMQKSTFYYICGSILVKVE